MLDDSDIKILNLLQSHGRVKRNQLAEEVGLSLPSVSERLNKLEERGVIEGYYAKINRNVFGYDILVFILVTMESSKHYNTLVANAKKNPNILECYSILGEGSHIMKAVAKNTKHLENLLGEIQSWAGVLSTKTFYVLSALKETTKLELEKTKNN